MGELDVIIDDGSHHAKDQLGTFLDIYQFVQPGGVYVCEDCAYNYDAGHTPTDQPTITDLASEVGCYIQVRAVKQAKWECPDLDTSVIDCAYGRRKSSLPMDLIESLVEVTASVMFFPSLVVFCKEKSS
jgi:hypothetical protein